MHTGRTWLPAVFAAVAILASACAGPSAAAPASTPSEAGEAGTGHIDMGDVIGTPLATRFEGRSVPVTGRVAARRDGCVTVVVDGVERLPVWPAGTSVEQSGDEDRYVVRLTGGVTLTADGAAGDTFQAAGVISADGAGATAGAEPPGKAESFLAFCGVEAAPVAFPDAGSFRRA